MRLDHALSLFFITGLFTLMICQGIDAIDRRISKWNRATEATYVLSAFHPQDARLAQHLPKLPVKELRK